VWTGGGWGRHVSSAAWAKEKVQHDGGDGGAVFRGPDAGVVVGIVADGLGDVAHGWPPGLGGILDAYFDCAPGEANYMQPFCGKIRAPDAKIEPTAEQLELL